MPEGAPAAPFPKGRLAAFKPCNLKRKPAADPLQVQRAVIYRTTISCEMLGQEKRALTRLAVG